MRRVITWLTLIVGVWTAPALGQNLVFAGAVTDLSCTRENQAMTGQIFVSAAQTKDGVIVAGGSNHEVTICNSSTGIASPITASITQPGPTAVDSSGTMYVIDAATGRLFMIATSGSISQLGAGFNAPEAIAVSKNGDVYIADTGNNRIVRLAADVHYEQSTVPVSVRGPQGVALSPDNTLYVSDTGNNTILAMAPDGTLDYIGHGLTAPTAIAVDGAGTLYVSDSGNARVLSISPISGAQNVVGGGISQPGSVAVGGDGNIFVVDNARSAILQITPAAYTYPDTAVGSSASEVRFYYSFTEATTTGTAVSSWLGSPGSVFSVVSDSCSNASFTAGNTCAVGITFSPSLPGQFLGALEIQDTFGSPLETTYISGRGIAPHLAFTPQSVTPVWNSFGFGFPTALSFDGSGNTYVADYMNDQIVKIAPDGSTSQVLSGSTVLANNSWAPLLSPMRLVVDGAGNLFVTDQVWGHVIEVPASGPAREFIGVLTEIEGAQLWFPAGMATDGAGDLYVADMNRNRIVKATPDGSYSVPVEAATSINGQPLQDPQGIAIDNAGTLYIADTGNNRIVTVRADGTTAELLSSTTAINGKALSNPVDLVLDSAGNLYVLDANNSRVVMVAPTGVASEYIPATLLTMSSMSYFTSMAISPTGDLYVADAQDNLIIQAARGSASVSITQDRPSMMVAAQNIGNAELSLSQVTVSSGAGAFELAGDSSCIPGASLTPGSSCTVDIDAVLSANGTPSGTVSITDNDDNNPSAIQTIAVSGYGLAAAPGQVALSGIGSQVTAGTAQDVTIRITDQFGNIESGYTGTVTFFSDDDRATIPSPYTFVASDRGVHVFSKGVIFGSTGDRQLFAVSSEGVSGSSGTYVSAGPPAAVTAIEGEVQSGTVGQLFTFPLLALVTDRYGNAVAGVPVMFASPAVGPSGSLSGQTVTTTIVTDSTGVAGATLEANENSGSYTVLASVSGIATPAIFNLTNTGPASAADGNTLSFNASPASIDVTTGNTRAVLVTIVPSPGFVGRLQFTCEGLPSNATCIFSQPVVAVRAGDPPIKEQVALSYGMRNTSTLQGESTVLRLGGIPFGMVLMTVLGIRRREQTWRGAALMLFITGMVAAGLSGCGVTRGPTGQGSNVARIVATVPETGTAQTIVTITLSQ